MVEVPKILGDVLEALVGAVYIDSGHDLKTVWRVFRNLFPHLDDIVKDPPKNAKKELLETFLTNKFDDKTNSDIDQLKRINNPTFRILVRLGLPSPLRLAYTTFSSKN